MLSEEEITNRFGFHKATLEGPNATMPKHRSLRIQFEDFAMMLNRLLPDGRYKDLCLDQLEMGSMLAHKAVAQDGELLLDDPKTSRVLRIMGKEANVALLDFNELIKNDSPGNVTQIRDYKNVKPTGEETVELGRPMHELGNGLAAALRDRDHVIIKDRWHDPDVFCFWFEDLKTGEFIFSHNKICDGEKCKPVFKDGKLEQ